MSPYLCITVRFLQPLYHGRTDGGQPEWPPSPLRLFQSLVAAAARRWREAQYREYAAPALKWMEQLTAPIIVAAVGETAKSKYRLYVPDNVADKVARAWSGGRDASIAEYRVEKDVRPTKLQGEAVHYLFALADGSSHSEVLGAAARSITHLGWGIDLVAADAKVISEDEATVLPGERWRPVEDPAAEGYRVPIAGTLEELERTHDSFLKRIESGVFKPVIPTSVFRVAGYRCDNETARRPFVAYRLWHPEQDRMAYFSATRAVSVAGMIRHALAIAARQSGWDEPAVVQYILGHRDNPEDVLPRFSYLPLPTIEAGSGSARRNVVGAIRRVIIAEPLGIPEKHVDWLRQVVSGQAVTDDSGHLIAILEPISKDGVLPRYVERATVWSTVSPVALPGSDDGKAAKTDKLINKVFRHAGYSMDAIADLSFRRFPFFPGAEDAMKYRPAEPHYLANCTMYHMRIRWKRPMTGPIALGSGRFCGLGVFAGMS